MNSALAAEGIRASPGKLGIALAALTQFPQGLRPATSHMLDGAAETVPLQYPTRSTLGLGWSLVPLTLATAVVAAPYLLTHGFPAVGFALYRGFAIVCHQRPERSFWIFGAEVAVCSRCLGIYLGAAMGLLFRTSRQIGLRLLIAAAALNLLDAMTELAGLHGNWLVMRFGLGLLLGAAAALMISSSVTRSAV
jgi:uncharacterized membrane protein